MLTIPPAPGNEFDGNGTYDFYLMRHGIAIRRPSPSALDDLERALAPDGKEKMQKIARGLQQAGLAVDWIMTSPLLYAVETAQIISDSSAVKVPVDLCEELRPGEPAEKLLSLLVNRPERKRVLLVGHEPGLSLLAARLLGAGSGANLAFKKGGCCLIRTEQLTAKPSGRLVWWLTPRILRALG